MEIEFLEGFRTTKKGQKIILKDFSVLTGENGSGKTNFLRGIAQNDIVSINNQDRDQFEIRYYGFNQFKFMPTESNFGYSSFDNSNINRIWLAYKAFQDGKKEIDESLLGTLKQIMENSQKDINDLTINDFKSIKTTRENERLDIFGLNFFKDSALYLGHRERNRYNEFRNIRYNEENIVFTPQEFESRYGTPPWQKINKIFLESKLNFKFKIPDLINRDEKINVNLIDTINNKEVKAEHLSSGEKKHLITNCLHIQF